MRNDAKFMMATKTEYIFKEVAYSKIMELVDEAIESQAFLPLKDDKQPFLRMLPHLFEGHADYHVFVLLSEEARQIGFVVILPHKHPYTVAIGPMYIRSQCRGQGGGMSLVQAVIRWARTTGVKQLWTKTWGGNIASRRIFERLGFSSVGEELDTRINGDSTVHYAFNFERDGV